VALQYLEEHDIRPEDATVSVQGFGNVGTWAAHDLAAAGAKIVAVSDTSCSFHNTDGIDVDAAIEHTRRTGELTGFKGEGEERDREALWDSPVTIVVPAALENAITADVAERLQTKMVLEIANGPTTPEADGILADKQVEVLPDIFVNAGGVTVSYYEWVQNTQGETWTQKEVESRLKKKMLAAYRAIHDRAHDENVTIRVAAYRLAIEKVAHAMLIRGAQ
jgi:glutamate dehydrogenase/leucine dehydrogenase